MFRMVFQSIISSSRLYIQQQVYIKQILLSETLVHLVGFTIEKKMIALSATNRNGFQFLSLIIIQ